MTGSYDACKFNSVHIMQVCPLCNVSYSHCSYYAIEWKTANEDFDSIAYSLNTVKERYV